MEKLPYDHYSPKTEQTEEYKERFDLYCLAQKVP